MIQQKTILKRFLVCPLDWGLGHAARMVPIINHLIQSGHDVMIAADNGPLEFLRQEFPSINTVVLPGTTIKYSRSSNQVMAMLKQTPSFLAGIRKEQKMVTQIAKQYSIDIIISDNRYGCFTNFTKNIIVTHQLMLKMTQATRMFEQAVHNQIKRRIELFDQCWVPDMEGSENLSGDLSHKYSVPKNTIFIGCLSRFMAESIVEEKEQILVLLSGPEPQRTILERKLLAQLVEFSMPVYILEGKTDERKEIVEGNIRRISHLSTEQMQLLILQSRYIISRAGYSTIMDLVSLGKKALLIPTPGQTEQEYLADFHKNSGQFLFCNQKNINLLEAFEKIRSTSFKAMHFSQGKLIETLSEI